MLSCGNIILHSALSIQHLPQAYVPLRGVGYDPAIQGIDGQAVAIVPSRGVGCDSSNPILMIFEEEVIVPSRGVGCDTTPHKTWR